MLIIIKVEPTPLRDTLPYVLTTFVLSYSRTDCYTSARQKDLRTNQSHRQFAASGHADGTLHGDLKGYVDGITNPPLLTRLPTRSTSPRCDRRRPTHGGLKGHPRVSTTHLPRTPIQPPRRPSNAAKTHVPQAKIQFKIERSSSPRHIAIDPARIICSPWLGGVGVVCGILTGWFPVLGVCC